MSEPEKEIEVTKQSDSADDTILDKLMGFESDIPEPKSLQNTQAVVESEPVKAQLENPNRAKAVSILKRDGVPQAVIDATSDVDLDEWVAKATKRQKDVDGYAAKMKALEKKGSAPSEPEVEDDIEIEEDLEIEPSEETIESDTTETETLNDDSEILGEESEKPKKVTKEQIAELKKAQQADSTPSLQYQVDVADSTLRYAYGELSPPKEIVVAEMNRLGIAKPNSYQNVMQLAEEAYINLLEKKANTTRPKRTSQPTVVKSVSRAERPTKPVDVEDAVLDQLMDGKSLEEARRFIRK